MPSGKDEQEQKVFDPTQSASEYYKTNKYVPNHITVDLNGKTTAKTEKLEKQQLAKNEKELTETAKETVFVPKTKAP